MNQADETRGVGVKGHTLVQVTTRVVEGMEFPLPSTCPAFPVSRLPAVNVATVPQRSPLRYPGGKTWLIPHIREWLSSTQARVLLDPFAGGGTVPLTAVMENLVDKAVLMERDHDLAAFWHVVLQDETALTKRIRDFTPTRELVSAIERTDVQCMAEHAFRTLVLNRTKRAGILAPGASSMNAGENGKGVLSRWYPDTLVARLEAIGEHADRLTFLEGDSMLILEPLLRGWGRDAVVFLDPPYTAAGGKRAGSRLYTHNTIDHTALFDMVSRCESDFLMTYDEAQEIVSLVQQYGFHAVRVEMKNAHHNRLAELVITRESLFS